MYHIYKIENKLNQNLYIGITTNPQVRKNRHFNYLRLNKHPNLHLQSAFNKYGEENFFFEILESFESDEECAYKKEAEYIEKFDAYLNGYNGNRGSKAHNGAPGRFTQEEIFQILACNHFYKRSGRVISEYFNCPNSTINNITYRRNYKNDCDIFDKKDEEEKRVILEDFFEISNIREQLASIGKHKNRKFSFEDIVILWIVHDHNTPFTKQSILRNILNTSDTRINAGLNQVYTKLAYADYTERYEKLSLIEKNNILRLYTEKYNEKPFELLEYPKAT